MPITIDEQIYLLNLEGGNGGPTPIHQPAASGPRAAGTHEVDFAATDLTPGLNYIIVVIDGTTYLQAVIKN